MKLVVKYKFEIILSFIIILLYFLLRLPNLTLQPIFADEAIYIRWAQVMRAEPALRFLPLSDGKTPLFMWSVMPSLKIFEDPLFAGRIVSVASGLFTLLGVGFLGWKFFSLKVALWAMFLYAIVPYMVFFDRMALVDSMLSAFSIWSLNFALLLAKYQRLDLSMILGYLLGAAVLTKTPAMVNLLLLPATPIGFPFKSSKSYSLLKLLIFWVVAIIIALSMYNALRLGPNFNMLSVRNADYVFSPVDLIGRPLDPFIPHLKDIIDWFPKLLTWPILILAVAGIIYVLVGFSRRFFSGPSLMRMGFVVLIWVLIPIIVQMAFLKTFTARYLLFSIPPLLTLAGFGIEKLLEQIKFIKAIKKAIKIVMVIILISAWPVYFDLLLLTNPAGAAVPKEERRGYLEDWTAGYNFKDIANFLIEQKRYGPVVVGTEGYFGTLPDGLQIYLDKSGIPVIGDQATISAKLRDAARQNMTFFVANKSRVGENLEGGKLIKEYPKAKPFDENPQDAILLYQVLSE